MKKLTLVALLATAIFGAEIDDFLDKTKCDKIADKGIFNICYSYKYKGAIGGWTTLDGKLAIKEGIKDRPRFYDEKEIDEQYRTTYSDYTGYGKKWNRGHVIAADADFDYSKETLIKTYTMANVVPFSAKVNQKTWTKVERYGRLIASKMGEVNSITLVSYNNPDNKFNGITIPSDFYRIYYNNNHNFKKCFHYANDLEVNIEEDKLREHEIDCKSIELK